MYISTWENLYHVSQNHLNIYNEVIKKVSVGHVWFMYGIQRIIWNSIIHTFHSESEISLL